MKKSFVLFFLVTAGCQLYAQSDSILYELRYKIINLVSEDTTKNIIQNRLLLISKNINVEKDLGRFSRDTAYASKYTRSFALANPSPTGGIMDVEKALADRMNDNGTDRQIYYDFKSGKYLYFFKMSNDYYFETPLTKYKWKLTDSVDLISGYTCAKALGHSSKGGEWIVWYCKDYPVGNNVFGITGVKGLIVKAVELKSNTVFELTGLQKGSVTFKEIKLPTYSVLVSKEEITKLEQDYLLDKRKFFKEHPLLRTKVTGN